jgi:hypothetical protein
MRGSQRPSLGTPLRRCAPGPHPRAVPRAGGRLGHTRRGGRQLTAAGVELRPALEVSRPPHRRRANGRPSAAQTRLPHALRGRPRAHAWDVLVIVVLDVDGQLHLDELRVAR